MFPEGTDNKASEGYLYPIGGFCILDIVTPECVLLKHELRGNNSYQYWNAPIRPLIRDIT